MNMGVRHATRCPRYPRETYISCVVFKPRVNPHPPSPPGFPHPPSRHPRLQPWLQASGAADWRAGRRARAVAGVRGTPVRGPREPCREHHARVRLPRLPGSLHEPVPQGIVRAFSSLPFPPFPRTPHPPFLHLPPPILGNRSVRPYARVSASRDACLLGPSTVRLWWYLGRRPSFWGWISRRRY